MKKRKKNSHFLTFRRNLKKERKKLKNFSSSPIERRAAATFCSFSFFMFVRFTENFHFVIHLLFDLTFKLFPTAGASTTPIMHQHCPCFNGHKMRNEGRRRINLNGWNNDNEIYHRLQAFWWPCTNIKSLLDCEKSLALDIIWTSAMAYPVKSH